MQVIYDPLTTQSAANNYARTPFTYNGKVNNIDPSRISPLMKTLYSLLPEPNIPGVNPVLGNNYSAPNPNIQNQYTYSMRFDQRISQKDLVYGRITKANGSTYRPNAGGVPFAGGFGNSRTDTLPNESLVPGLEPYHLTELLQRVPVQRQPDVFRPVSPAIPRSITPPNWVCPTRTASPVFR